MAPAWAARPHPSSTITSTNLAGTICITSIFPIRREDEDAPPSAFLVVQDGRKYFENISFIQRVESHQAPVQTVEIGGAAAVRVYRDEEFAELRTGR